MKLLSQLYVCFLQCLLASKITFLVKCQHSSNPLLQVFSKILTQLVTNIKLILRQPHHGTLGSDENLVDCLQLFEKLLDHSLNFLIHNNSPSISEAWCVNYIDAIFLVFLKMPLNVLVGNMIYFDIRCFAFYFCLSRFQLFSHLFFLFTHLLEALIFYDKLIAIIIPITYAKPVVEHAVYQSRFACPCLAKNKEV